MINRAAPNVVTEKQLKYLLQEEGYTAEIVCQEQPQLKYGQWKGSWFVRAVDPDGKTEKLLVPLRTDPKQGIQVREFKTANGIVSFLLALGFDDIYFPMVEGRKVQVRLSETDISDS